MMFGFVAAAVGGFILTSAPNRTGRLPVRGTPLAGLALLWLAGRLAVWFSASIGPIAGTLDVNLECADRIADQFDDVFRFAQMCG